MIVKYECKCCKAQFTDEQKGNKHETLCFERKGVAETITLQMNALVKLAKKYDILITVKLSNLWDESSVQKVTYNLPKRLGWQCPYIEMSNIPNEPQQKS